VVSFKESITWTVVWVVLALCFNFVGEEPEMHLGELLNRKDLQVGVWRCTPCVWEYDFYKEEEIMLMLSGRLRLTDSDGKATELTKGDVFYIPRGWSGKWETLETMEKLYVIID